VAYHTPALAIVVVKTNKGAAVLKKETQKKHQEKTFEILAFSLNKFYFG
jgi:hypothetical protein